MNETLVQGPIFTERQQRVGDVASDITLVACRFLNFTKRVATK